MFSISVNCTNAKEAAKVLTALNALVGGEVVAAPKPAKLDDEADEAPTPRKRGRPAKAEPKEVEIVEDEEEIDEETETGEDEEEIEDESEEDEAPEVVEGEDLAKLKKALQAFSKAKGSKDAAVKVLRKFAPSSEKVKVGDLKALLKALKV